MFIKLIRLMIVLFHFRPSQEIVTLVLWLHKPLFRLLLPDISRFDPAAGAAVFAWEWSCMVVLQVRCSWRLKHSSKLYCWPITYCAGPKSICWLLLEIQNFANEAPLSFTSLIWPKSICLSPNFRVTLFPPTSLFLWKPNLSSVWSCTHFRGRLVTLREPALWIVMRMLQFQSLSNPLSGSVFGLSRIHLIRAF